MNDWDDDDEYVTLYHGTDAVFDVEDLSASHGEAHEYLLEDGVEARTYFSLDRDDAVDYAQGGRVLEYRARASDLEGNELFGGRQFGFSDADLDKLEFVGEEHLSWWGRVRGWFS